MSMKHQRLLAIGLAAVLTVGLGGVQGALAVSAEQTGLSATAAAAGVANSRSIVEIVGTVINTALGLVGVILLLLVIYAGFNWMTAQGDLEKVKKAKATLSNAAVGMVIIFGAYSITDYVMKGLITSMQEGASSEASSPASVGDCEASCAAMATESERTDCTVACMVE